MSEIRFEIQGTDQLRAALQALGPRAQDSMGRALVREAEQIMTASKRWVPVNTGVLKGSGFVEPVEEQGFLLLAKLGYGGAAAAYALYVHEGTGPAVGRPSYFPPVEPLERWAELHGMKGAGYAIARAIFFRGTLPTKYLQIPFQAAKAGMAARMAAFLRRELRAR